jgi:FTR1 family protein
VTRALVLAVALFGVLAGTARADALSADVAARYRQAAIAHDATLAARLRTETRLMAEVDPRWARLAATVAQTRNALRPWPLADTVDRLAGGEQAPASGRPYDAIRRELDVVEHARDRRTQVSAALRAYALSAGLSDPALDGAFQRLLVSLDRRIEPATDRVRAQLSATKQQLGDVRISRATVVTDAAILVFREGLEAVLILAAITASFTGARRALRRPVLIGGLAGIGATALTWAVAQLLISQLGTGGLRLEAITGLLAIAVLLVVTNWFFHKVYWSQWIARFNRRRKRLEKVGFLSGQAVGLGILGLTSVYREGFETVLFVQSLQVSAGTSACVLGSAIGLAGTLAVGLVTFHFQRKLPYKRMLIVTGALIAVVLAVMTGTTAHVMQGLGWLPSTPTSFSLPLWASRWLGLYATWEGIALQALALAAVLASYFLAREIQVRRPRRRASRSGVTPQPDTVLTK